MMNEAKWYLRTLDETFGPESESRLIEWARMGRIQPGQEVSDDNEVWRRVEDVPFLDMRFSIDIGDGNPRGPFNKYAAEALLSSGRLPATATIVEVREPFPVDPSAVEEDIGQPPVEERRENSPEVREVRIEVPVEKIVEKIVEKEVRVEVPVEKIVEKIVEVEKIVVDDKRVKELESLLADAQARSSKLSEQVVSLESELRRLPAAASEIADIQAAVFKIMQDESAALAAEMEIEKQYFEEFKRRQQERLDRMVERRHELVKRSGNGVDDMTRKALIERPEDPRTLRLRRDYEELQRIHEKAMLDSEAKIRKLNDELRQRKIDETRMSEGMKDVTQLRAETQHLREMLQRTEKELVAERQKCEELRQREATSRQVLMARLASLESPSIGTAKTISSNQSREAKMVKLPGWMRLKN